MLILILIFVMIVVPACTWWFGLWNNLINLVNFLLAALIATSVYHPVANQIINIEPRSYGGLADFVAVWLTFALAFIVLRGITDAISKYQLKFDTVTELAGRSVLALLLGLGVMCFTSFTLQLAPLPPSLYSAKAEGSFPDQLWLGYTGYASTGPLAASKSSNVLFKEYKLDDLLKIENVSSRDFDPANRFYRREDFRRRQIQKRKSDSK